MEVFLGMYGHFSCLFMGFSSDFTEKTIFEIFFSIVFIEFLLKQDPPRVGAGTIRSTMK